MASAIFWSASRFELPNIEILPDFAVYLHIIFPMLFPYKQFFSTENTQTVRPTLALKHKLNGPAEASERVVLTILQNNGSVRNILIHMFFPATSPVSEKMKSK